MVSRTCLMMCLLVALLVSSRVLLAMQSLDDDSLADVVAQGLIVTDKIGGSELAGANQFSSPFTFYRMGLDGEMALNLNAAKIQLGCGGANDYLDPSVGCDIDLDYATLMGKNAAANAPGDPLSEFILKRPYMELAIKQDNDPTRREIAGIKIGAESADGAISAGRRYFTNGAINQENTAVGTSCNTGASTGNGVLGCHSGINSVSGFLGAEMSITMRVQARVCILGIVFGNCLGGINLDAYGCAGRTQTTVDDCGTARSDALFVDAAGTRMSSLNLNAAQLALTGQNLVGSLADALLGNAYASLEADLRLVHYLVFDETPDFFLSFQREPVAYPRYDKTTPTSSLAAGAFDSCSPGSSSATARCSSAYAVPANTGWWLNAPSVKLLDVYNDDANLGNLTIGDALSLLAAPGYSVANPEFQLTPAQNCYGASVFC